MVKTNVPHLKQVRIEWDKVLSEHDVFIDILSRVPVKSLCSFKMVCKSWNGLISSKYFAKQQLTQSRENPSFISCPKMDNRMKLYSMKPETLELVSLNTISPVQRSHENHMYMISSFNGLICCINQISDEDVENKFCDMQIWICNPSTGETLLLPQGSPSFEVGPSVGVAYDSDISDYRVFRIFCAGKKIPEERVSAGFYFEENQFFTKFRYALAYECEVYSSSTGSWKNIGPVPCVPLCSSTSPYRYGHVFVGGKIFWLVSLDEPGEILSVDLDGRSEVMELPLYPDHLNDEDKITEATYLIVLQGCLSVVILHPGYMDVWVWRTEGEKSSWALVCEDNVPFDDYELVLVMTSLKNQILCMTETDWWTYDMDSKIWNVERGSPSGFWNPSVFPFTESLLPCNGGVRL